MGQDVTFRDIDEMSEKFVIFLHNDGNLEQGDRVAIQLPNLIQYPVAAWGILRAGLVLVNSNPMYTERGLRHQFKDSDTKAVVILNEFLPVAQKVIPDTDIKAPSLVMAILLAPWRSVRSALKMAIPS